MKRILLLTLCMAITSAALCACGQSGRLYLPDPNKPTKVNAS